MARNEEARSDSSQPRILIIGLDGATFDLLNPLMAAGELPAIAGLIERGISGVLNAWPNSNSAAAWSSMVTGYNSGQHGIYHFHKSLLEYDTATGWHPTVAAHRRKAPFWRTLSAAGKRVGIINIPITYPADAINGFMLAGMDTPGIESRGFAHPARLPDELRRQGIEYVIDVANLGVASRAHPHRLPSEVRRMIEMRSRAILHLMQAEAWDVLMAVFVATDRVQHYYWPEDLTDVSAPDWQPIRTVYRLIDDFFAQALKLIDDNTTVMIVSDHGFGSTQPAKNCTNLLLERLGILRFRQKGVSVKGKLLNSLLRAGRRTLPIRLQDRLARTLPRLHLQAVNSHSQPKIDWSATKAFASKRGGRVWINLQDRHPAGIVPADQYDALCNQISKVLQGMRDLTTGQPIVRKVYRRAEVFQGPFAAESSDLLIEWNDEALQDAVTYVREGESIVIHPKKQDGGGNRWIASHRPDGVFVACGPTIKTGATISGANLYDITPTILYLQGQPIPNDMEGRVLTDIFTDERVAALPVRLAEPNEASSASSEAQLAVDEVRQIEERLKGLGYIE